MKSKKRCFNCGKPRPQSLEQIFHSYYENLCSDNEPDAWIQFEGWTELFLDPEKVKSDDEEQLWFVSLCPKCSDKLGAYLVEPKEATEP